MVRGMEKQSGGALYDTAMLRGYENDQGNVLYDTATIICKGVVKTVRGMHYMTQQR